MKTLLRHGRVLATLGVAVLGVLTLSGCEYDVPLTAKPTRAIESKLIGDWRSPDGKDLMKIRQLDDTSYAVTYNGDLYRAHHTETGGQPWVSVLHLDPSNRKYSFLTWTLTGDARGLRLRVVSSKVVSKELADSTALQRALEKNSSHPALFGFEQDYRRVE